MHSRCFSSYVLNIIMINSQLEFELVKLKLKAAEAARLQSRRNELLDVFDKLNLSIPDQVKSHIESTYDISYENLEEKVQDLIDENIALLTNLHLYTNMVDIGDMIRMQNLKLKVDIEYIQDSVNSNPDYHSILELYLQELSQRLNELDNDKSRLMNQVILKECKMDILTSKLSHLYVQLKEPIFDLRLKEEYNLPLTDEDILLLKVLEMSVLNSKLKNRIDEIKSINSNLYDELYQMQGELIKKIKKASENSRFKQCELFEHYYRQDKDSQLDTSSVPSIASSYSMDIYRTDSNIKHLEIAILGTHTAEVNRMFYLLENLRERVYEEQQEEEQIQIEITEETSETDEQT